MKDQQELVAGRHVPDIGLALVHVVGLDGAGADLRVVDLLALEVLQLAVHAGRQPAEFGDGTAVVVEARKIDDLHAVDARSDAVVLIGEAVLGLLVDLHRDSRSA